MIAVMPNRTQMPPAKSAAHASADKADTGAVLITATALRIPPPITIPIASNRIESIMIAKETHRFQKIFFQTFPRGSKKFVAQKIP